MYNELGSFKLIYLIINSVVQLLLLLTGLLILISFVGYLFKPELIYLHHFSNTKAFFISNYKTFSYDFTRSSGSYKVDITKMYEFLVGLMAKESLQFIIINTLIGIANLIIIMFSILAFKKKLNKLVLAIGILSMIMTICILVRICTYSAGLRGLSIRMMNISQQYKGDIFMCTICYKNIKFIPTRKLQSINFLAFSMHAFECCGVESYNDVLYKNQIPFTCCPRTNYSKAYVKKGKQCQKGQTYTGCLEKLVAFLSQKSLFYYHKLVLFGILTLNIFHGIPSIIIGVISILSQPKQEVEISLPLVSPLDSLDNKDALMKMANPPPLQKIRSPDMPTIYQHKKQLSEMNPLRVMPSLYKD